MAQLWIAAGGPPVLAEIMAEIGWTESSGDPNARSSVGALGLWQNHPPQGDETNPTIAARRAVDKWRTQGLAAWTNFNPKAATLVRRAKFPTGPGQLPSGARSARVSVGLSDPFRDPRGFLDDILPFGDGGGLPSIPNPLEGIEAVADAIRQATKTLVAFVQTWLELMRKVLSPQAWMDVGKIILGAWLIFIGLRRLVEVQIT